MNVGATVYKTTAHLPANGDYYELDEVIDYTITVKNVKEVTLEDLRIYDSLGGLNPIDTLSSLASGEEKTFNFSWTVTQDDIDRGYVVNSATLTYTFTGIAGTPVKSNEVYVKAGENGYIPGEGMKSGHDGDQASDGGILHFPGLDDYKGKTFCALELVTLGDGELRYTLHTCDEHAAVADRANNGSSVMQAGEIAALWRDEINELYEKLYEAGDDIGKAAILNDQVAYWVYIHNWMNVYHDDEALAEMMRLRCAELCCMLHTAPDALPDSLTGNYALLLDSVMNDHCERILNEDNEEVTIYLDADHAKPLSDTLDLISGAASYDRDKAFRQAQCYWQIALDNVVNATYKAADRENRKVIAVWRQSLDQLIGARTEMLNMMYDSSATAAEEVLNLYRDALIDVCEKK